LGQLRKIEADLVKAGYRIIAVSPDRPEKIRQLTSGNEYAYTLLSDSELNLARALGIAYHVDDKTFEMLMGYNFDIEEASGEKHHLLPVPSVFILNRKGQIDFEYVNPNYHVRIDADLLLAAARAVKK
jgi:peroxiredoxin